MTATFDQLRDWAKEYWGLVLSRADPQSRGWWNGCWKSGFVLSGQFPDERHQWRRYSTLKELEKVLAYHLKAKAEKGRKR